MLQREAGFNFMSVNEDDKFDVSECGKLVPELDESDLNEFFLHIEKVAVNKKCPKGH